MIQVKSMNREVQRRPASENEELLQVGISLEFKFPPPRNLGPETSLKNAARNSEIYAIPRTFQSSITALIPGVETCMDLSRANPHSKSGHIDR
jgi:hypothetical protein